MPRARFDDMTSGREHSFELVGLEEVVVAHSADHVADVLRRVERATDAGQWAAGFVSYEAAPGLDRALAVAPETRGAIPAAWFGIFRSRIAVEQLAPRAVSPAPYHMSAWRAMVDRRAHAAAIGRIRDHIADGDTYQVNYTFRLTAAFSGDPFELYHDMVLAQRGAFGVYLDTGRYCIASASPELFFARGDGRIELRPMKGTIPRGRWPEEDEAKAQALTGSAKDRAENLMIVDLLRNDVGRVAEFGTVRVDDLFALERYETVWQLTSRISAEVPDDVGLVDVFAAVFPSGSVTGAPKPRTMEIITELETSPRGVYCGAVGCVAPRDEGGRRATFNVAIRTATVDCDEGTATYGVGGGITWDSDSEGEYEEARAKARVLGERRPEFSLLETLRWDPGEGYALLDRHLERLAASAAYFGFPLNHLAVAAALQRQVNGATVPHRVRLVVGRDASIDVAAGPLAAPFHHAMDPGADPVWYMVDDVPINSGDVFMFHKTTRRYAYDQRLKRHPAADEVLMINERGEITEFTTGNVVVEIDGTWRTPPVAAGLLGGVFRAHLIAAGGVVEDVVTRRDLARATQVAFVNSVRGWRPARPLPLGASAQPAWLSDVEGVG